MVAQHKHAVAHRWQVLQCFVENMSEFLLLQELTGGGVCRCHAEHVVEGLCFILGITLRLNIPI